MKSTLLSFWLSALLMLLSQSISAHDFQVDGIYYNITSSIDLTVSVTHQGTNYNSYSGDVFIPDNVSYSGKIYSVNSIGQSAFKECTGLTSITMPNSITNIGISAFQGCTELTRITLPSRLIIIEEGAFRDCSGLTSITIPNSVTSIGRAAFRSCTGLQNITISNSVTNIDKNSFYGCINLKTVYNCSPLILTSGSSDYGYVAYYADYIYNCVQDGDYFLITIDNKTYVFCYVGSETDLILPNVDGIFKNAFAHCTYLNNVTIPSCMTTIGESAFQGCSGITTIIIPKNITNICNDAFKDCINLKKVYNCSSLNICLGDNSNGYVAYYANCAYNYCEVDGDFIITTENNEKYVLAYLGGTPDPVLPEVYGIADGAFIGDTTLISVTIPNGIIYIGESSFRNCTHLQKISIPNSVTNIGDYAFDGCASLQYSKHENGLYLGNEENPHLALIGTYSKNITILDINYTCKIIVSYALHNCSKLTHIDFSNGLTSIGRYAFEGCSELTSITIPINVTNIGDYAFYGCNNLDTIYNCSALTFSSKSIDYGYIAYYAHNVYNGCQMENDYVLFTTNQAKYALKYLGSASDIVLPQVEVIGESVFKNHSELMNITIPNCVTRIENDAFSGCTSIKKLIFEDGASSLSLGYKRNSNNSSYYWGLFTDCPIESLYIGRNLTYSLSYFNDTVYGSPFEYKSGLSSISIGNNVTNLGKFAFNGCTESTSIIIPNSMTGIGEYAFYGFTGLTSISIPNSVSSIGNDAFYGCTELTSINIPNSVTSIGYGAFSNCI